MSKLKKELAKAADIREHLDAELARGAAWSYDAAFNAACNYAGRDPGDAKTWMDECREHPSFADVVIPAARRLATSMAGWTGGPPRPSRLNPFIGERVDGVLTALGGARADLTLFALELLKERHPDRFPKDGLDDPEKHDERIRKLKQDLEVALACVAAAVAFIDVEHRDVSDGERTAGLCRLEFREYPGVFVGKDMADQLLAAEIRRRQTSSKAA